MRTLEHVYSRGLKVCECGKYHYRCDRCGDDCTMGSMGGPGHSYPHPTKEYRSENFVTFCRNCDETVNANGFEAVYCQMFQDKSNNQAIGFLNYRTADGVLHPIDSKNPMLDPHYVEFCKSHNVTQYDAMPIKA